MSPSPDREAALRLRRGRSRALLVVLLALVALFYAIAMTRFSEQLDARRPPPPAAAP